MVEMSVASATQEQMAELAAEVVNSGQSVQPSLPTPLFALPAAHAKQLLLSALGSNPASQRQSRIPVVVETSTVFAKHESQVLVVAGLHCWHETHQDVAKGF